MRETIEREHPRPSTEKLATRQHWRHDESAPQNRKAFRKGLAWIPAGNILRISPPLIMDDDVALKGLDAIEEAIQETKVELGYGA